jgi:23S rRNA (adenine2503-C2)-methyltransferase
MGAVTAPDGKLDLLSLAPDELALFVRGLGEPAYRAGQLFSWLHRGAPFEHMTDLPRPMRGRLSELAVPGVLALDARREAPDGAAKLAFRTPDDQLIEAVLIPHRARTTVCVSSQIGCAFGCRFCATGRQGFVRDLTPGEIVAQVVRVQHAIRPARVGNIVFMGMGEPLANYQAVVKAVRLLNHPDGINVGARHIAISTCGLPGEIRRLADEGVQVALAISLHAATDDVRTQLVPINRTHPIADVVAAARHYAERTGRKVAFQYVVVPDLNDTPAEARRLAALTRELPCMVNLIPQNPLSEGGRADPRPALRFAGRLKRAGVAVAVRRSRGAEVLGACGQLRAGQSKTGRTKARPA